MTTCNILLKPDYISHSCGLWQQQQQARALYQAVEIYRFGVNYDFVQTLHEDWRIISIDTRSPEQIKVKGSGGVEQNKGT